MGPPRSQVGRFIATVGARLISVGANLAFIWLATVVLSTEAAGGLVTAVNGAFLASVLFRLGADSVICRRVAAGSAHDAATTIAAARTWSLISAIGSASVVVAMATVASDAQRSSLTVLLGSLMLGLVLALSNIDAEVLRGLGRPVDSQLLKGGAFYALACVALLVVGPLPATSLDLLPLMGAAVIPLAWSTWRLGPPNGAWRLQPASTLRRFGRDASAVSLVTVFNQGSTWLVPVLAATVLPLEDIPVLVAALRIAAVVSLPLTAANAAYARELAGVSPGAADTQRDAASLPGALRAFRSAMLASSAAALAIWVAAVGMAPWLLGLLGPGFDGGVAALRIAATAHLVNVLAGPIGELLLMQSMDRIVLVGSAASGVGLVLALLAPGGAGGVTTVASIAGAAIVARNLVLLAGARLRLGRWPHGLRPLQPT